MESALLLPERKQTKPVWRWIFFVALLFVSCYVVYHQKPESRHQLSLQHGSKPESPIAEALETLIAEPLEDDSVEPKEAIDEAQEDPVGPTAKATEKVQTNEVPQHTNLDDLSPFVEKENGAKCSSLMTLEARCSAIHADVVFMPDNYCKGDPCDIDKDHVYCCAGPKCSTNALIKGSPIAKPDVMEYMCKVKDLIFKPDRHCYSAPCYVENDWKHCCEPKANCANIAKHTGKACTGDKPIVHLGRNCAGTTCVDDDFQYCCTRQNELHRATQAGWIWRSPSEMEHRNIANKVVKSRVYQYGTGEVLLAKLGEDGKRIFISGDVRRTSRFKRTQYIKRQTWMQIVEPVIGWVVFAREHFSITKEGLKEKKDNTYKYYMRKVYPGIPIECDTRFKDIETILQTMSPNSEMEFTPGDTVQVKCPSYCDQGTLYHTVGQGRQRVDNQMIGLNLDVITRPEWHMKSETLDDGTQKVSWFKIARRVDYTPDEVRYQMKNAHPSHPCSESSIKKKLRKEHARGAGANNHLVVLAEAQNCMNKGKKRVTTHAKFTIRENYPDSDKKDKLWARWRTRREDVEGCGVLNNGAFIKTNWFTKDSLVCASSMGLKSGFLAWETFDVSKSPTKHTEFPVCDLDSYGIITKGTTKETPEFGYRVAPLGKDTVDITHSGYWGRFQSLRRSWAMSDGVEKVQIVAKILLKTVLGLAIGISTTCLIASFVALPWVVAGGAGVAFTGILAITLGRTAAAMIAGAAVDATVDWWAEGKYERPMEISEENKSRWQSLKDHQTAAFRALFTKRALKDWGKAMLWETIGHGFSISGIYSGPFQFNMDAPIGFVWEGDYINKQFSFKPKEATKSRSIKEDMYGTKFDYTPSLVTATVDAYLDIMSTRYNKETGKDPMDMFFDIALAESQQSKKEDWIKGDLTFENCDPKDGCWAKYLAVDDTGRLVIGGMTIIRILEFFNVDYMWTKVTKKTSEVYDPETIQKQGLDPNREIDFYYYDVKPDKKDDKKDRSDEQYEKDQIDWQKSDIAMKDAASLDRLQAY